MGTDLVDVMHEHGVFDGALEAAVNTILERRGQPPASREELDAATPTMVEASKRHVEAAGDAFEKALAERRAAGG